MTEAMNILKHYWSYYVLLLLTFLSPISGIIISIGVLITIDFILGIIAAFKTKTSINSTRMADTLIKVFAYQLLILSSFIVETQMADWLPLVQITSSFIGITELLSIGENFQKITGIGFVTYLKEQITKYGKPAKK